MGTEAAGIYAVESGYLDRYVQVGYASDRVLSVTFPTTPDDDASDDLPVLADILAYLEGEEITFQAVQVAMTMPTNQQEVLDAVRDIPYGDQVTVDELANMTPGLDPDNEDNRQLIRTALAENPVPLIIPDHRVRDGPSAAPPEVEQRLRSLEGL